MLRNDLAQVSSSSAPSTTSTRPRRRARRAAAAAFLVEGSSKPDGVDHGERAALGVQRQRGAQRPAARLAVDLDRVAARLGAEGHAAADPLRAGRARPRERGRCPSGARPWRRSSRPRRGSCVDAVPAPAGVQLGAHRLVHERPWNCSPKTASSSVDACRCLCRARRRGLPSAHVRPDLDDGALGGPGTEPRTSSRFLSATHVDDLEAALGHALVAHLARAADALEHARRGRPRRRSSPGARTLCEPCEPGRGEKLWRLTVPWKPLPFETPETFTRLALLERRRPSRSSPTLSSPASSRNSREVAKRRRRRPSSGGRARAFVSRFSLHLAEARAARPRSRRARRGGSPVTEQGPASITVTRSTRPSSASKTCVIPSFSSEECRHAHLRSAGSGCPRRPGGGRAAGASRPSSAWAGGCRSAACACGSRSARASPCP